MVAGIPDRFPAPMVNLACSMLSLVLGVACTPIQAVDTIQPFGGPINNQGEGENAKRNQLSFDLESILLGLCRPT